MRILLVEDDTSISQTLQDLLKPDYEVDLAETGSAAFKQLRQHFYDLILLDLGLPDMSGITVCKKIRAGKNRIPILILTGDDSIRQKVASLDTGADDYITKPFNFKELSARIRAILRRNSRLPSSGVIMYNEIIINCDTRQVSDSNKVIQLRRKEFTILAFLLKNKGRVVTRSMLLDHVWTENFSPFANSIDVHINHLRRKVEKPLNTSIIKTVHGIGYTIP